MEPEVFSSGFILFRKQNGLQFLLMKHADRWDLPKGHLDSGETKQQAAARELEEETGISLRQIWVDPDFLFEQEYWVSYKKSPAKRKWKQLTIYLGLLQTDVRIQATEHQGYGWFDWHPPHFVQEQMIDPLLASLEVHFRTSSLV
jgi:bis(5'-nucleosidyl)-tetraphosphatase